MGKTKRQVVGSVCKAKDASKPDYVKMRDGRIFRLESPKFQLENLNKAVRDGKLSEEVAQSIRERIEKIPAFVRFEMVELTDAE